MTQTDFKPQEGDIWLADAKAYEFKKGKWVEEKWSKHVYQSAFYQPLSAQLFLWNSCAEVAKGIFGKD